MYSIRRVRGCD